MNIFILSADPHEAAVSQCDAHVVKMLLESTQLLCNCLPENTFPEQYKRTHYNHPCSIWTRSSHNNAAWLLNHAFWLSYEYTHRYCKVHKCHRILQILVKILVSHGVEYSTPKEFAICMPSQFIAQDNPVESYRNYYQHKKETMHLFRYTRRAEPSWLSL